MKRYDLMHNINTRGTFLLSKECLPYLLKSQHAHILNISPPLDMLTRWFSPHVAYTMAKFGMSMCVLGMAEEFRDRNLGVNALWPRRIVHTAAVEMLRGSDAAKKSRSLDVMADAAYVVLCKNPQNCTGNFFVDEEVLIDAGIKDLKQYALFPENCDDLIQCFFLPERFQSKL